MESIVARTEALLSCDNQKTISTELVNIQHDLCAKLVVNFKEDDIVSLFSKFWLAIFKLSNNQSSGVRLTSYSTITVFLMKLCPFFPGLICRSFTNVINECDLDSSSSYVIVASFAYLTNYIAPILLQDFLNATPVFHYFFQASSLSSERLSSIISNLPALGDYWFNTVFAAFLTQYIKNPSRTVLSSISMLLVRAPKTLTKLLIQFGNENNWNQNYITILAFLITAKEFDTTIDYAKPQMSTFEYLQIDSSPAFKSDCFKILSVYSEGLKITRESPTVLDFTLNNKTIKVEFLNFCNEPSFFMLPLPWDLLEPKDDDSMAIFSSKLENIGKLTGKSTDKAEIDRTIALLDKITREKPDQNGSVLKCIEFCGNNIILMTDDSLFSSILYRVIFAKENSWFQCANILRSFKIDHRLFKKAFGPQGAKMIRMKAIDFAKNQNRKFSKEAIPFVVELSHFFFDEITSEILVDTDFFDDESIILHLRMLGEVLMANPGRDLTHLQDLPKILLELPITGELELISTWFIILSFFDASQFKTLQMKIIIESAILIIHATRNVLTGSRRTLNAQSQINTPIVENTNNFLLNRTIDITEAGSVDYKVVLHPIYAATRFILSLPFDMVDRKFLLSACERMFRFFPELSTSFIINHINDLTDDEKIHTIKKLHKQLDAVSSPHIHAQWAEIALMPLASEDRIPNEFIAHIVRDSLFFIENTENVADEDLYSFAAFLSIHDDACREHVSKFLHDLNQSQIHTFASLSHVKYQAMAELFPEEFARINAKDVTLSDQTVLHQFIKTELKSEDDINFVREHLSGLDLKIFEDSIKPVDHSRKTSQETAKLACNTRNEVMFQTAILDSIIFHETIDFTKIDIPPSYIPFICEHIKDKNVINEILSQFTPDDAGTEKESGILMKAILDFENFVKVLRKLDRLTKAQMRVLIRAMEEVKVNSQIALDLVLNLMDQQYSKIRQNFVVHVVTNFIKFGLKEKRDSISNFRIQFFSFLNNHPEANTWSIAAAMCELSKFHVFLHTEPTYVENLIRDSGVVSLAACRMNEAKMSTYYDLVNFRKLVASYTTHFLPSALNQGFRLMAKITSAWKSEKLYKYFSKSFMTDFQNILQYRNNPVMLDTMCDLLESILTVDVLHPIQSMIYDNFTMFTGEDLDNPSVILVNNRIAPIIANKSNQSANLLKEITRVVRHYEHSSSYFEYSINMRIREAMIKSYSNTDKRQHIITERFINWMHDASDLDGYLATNFYNDWLNIFLKYSAKDSVSQIAVSQIFRHAKRYFVAIQVLISAFRQTDAEGMRIFTETLQSMKNILQEEEWKWNAISKCLEGKFTEALDLCHK